MHYETLQQKYSPGNVRLNAISDSFRNFNDDDFFPKGL
jgi:hypothetical protein